MKSFLHDRPVLLLGLNEDLAVKGLDDANRSGLLLDDVVLHECVDLQRFEEDRVLAYVCIYVIITLQIRST